MSVAIQHGSRAPAADVPLAVEGLTTSIRIAGRWFDAVRDVSFTVAPRETLALVGESGCGKSLTALYFPNAISERAKRALTLR